MEIVKENNLYILHFARIISRFLRIPKEKKNSSVSYSFRDLLRLQITKQAFDVKKFLFI